MKKRRRTTNPRRFTVELVDGQHLRILAADEPTRAWAVKLQAKVSIPHRLLVDELAGKRVIDEPLPWEPPPAESDVLIATVRLRFAELLRASFPFEAFDVAPAQPTCVAYEGQEKRTSDEVARATLAKLAGIAGP